MNMPEPTEHIEQAKFEAGGFYLLGRREEMLVPLTEMEFKVLTGGELNDAKSGRDLCIGIFVTSMVGAVGLIATIDWNAAYANHKHAPFVWTGLMFCAAAAALLGAIIYGQRYYKTSQNSPYATLVAKLSANFRKAKSD